MPVLILKALHQNLHQKGSTFPFSGEQNPRQGQAAVLLLTMAAPARRLDPLAATHGKKVSWRNPSQVGVASDLVRPVARPFGEISFDQGL